MRWEDRGSAFATWRIEPDRGDTDDLWLGFRLCFIVEPAIPASESVLMQRNAIGLARRAQAFLSPWTHTIHVDIDGTPVSDQRLLSVLERPYRSEISAGRRDINLGSRLAVLHEVIDPTSFRRACEKVRESASKLLEDDVIYRTRSEAAVRQARAYVDRSDRRLRQRAVIEPAALATVEAELATNGAVLAAVNRPRIRLDAMGLFVISGTAPTGAS
jgi:ATP-dependent helicase HepA